jgi:hypothetical protein
VEACYIEQIPSRLGDFRARSKERRALRTGIDISVSTFSDNDFQQFSLPPIHIMFVAIRVISLWRLECENFPSRYAQVIPGKDLDEHRPWLRACLLNVACKFPQLRVQQVVNGSFFLLGFCANIVYMQKPEVTFHGKISIFNRKCLPF